MSISREDRATMLDSMGNAIGRNFRAAEIIGATGRFRGARLFAEMERPWLLEAGVARELYAIVQRHADGAKLDPAEVEAIVGRGRTRLSADMAASLAAAGRGVPVAGVVGADYKGYYVINGVAVVPIAGVLHKYSASVMDTSRPSGTSYEAIRSALMAAADDRDVATILLHIDSPGGTVDGIEQTAELIRAIDRGEVAGGGRPVVALYDGLAASAALWLGSQARAVYAADSSTQVGSVGARVTLVSYDRALKAEGYDVEHVASSPSKVLGGGEMPITDALRVRARASVAEWHGRFVAALEAGRGERLSAAERGEVESGAVWMAERAIALGLVDAIERPGALVARLAGEQGSGRAIGNRQSAMGQGTGGHRASADSPLPIAHCPETNDGHAARAAVVGSAAAAILADAEPSRAAARDEGMDAGSGNVATEATDMRRARALFNAAGTAGGGGANVGAQGTGAAGSPAQPTRGTEAHAAPAANNGNNNGTAEAIAAAREQAAIQAERARIAAIEQAAAPFAGTPGLAEALAAAKAGGTAPEAFTGKVLELVAKARTPVAAIGVRVGEDGSARFARHAGTAIALRVMGGKYHAAIAGKAAGNDESLYAEMGRRVVPRGDGGRCREYLIAEAREVEGNGLAGMSIKRIAMQCAQQAGLDPMTLGDRELFEGLMRAGMANGFGAGGVSAGAGGAAGHSSSSFPAILKDAANKILLASFMEPTTVYEQFCQIISVSDFRDVNLSRLSGAADFQPLAEGQSPSDIKFGDRGNRVSVTRQGIRLSYTYEMLRNDDLGAFAQIPEKIGMAARRRPEQVVMKLITDNPLLPYDGVAVFSTAASRNTQAASGGAITVDTLKAGINAMRSRKDFKTEKPIEVNADVLLCPIGLEIDAGTVIRSPVIAGTGLQAINTPTPESVRRLSIAASYHLTGTAWYLIGTRGEARPLVVAFLDGQRTPIIEELPQQTMAKIDLEAMIPGLGAAIVDHEPWWKNPG